MRLSSALFSWCLQKATRPMAFYISPYPAEGKPGSRVDSCMVYVTLELPTKSVVAPPSQERFASCALSFSWHISLSVLAFLPAFLVELARLYWLTCSNGLNVLTAPCGVSQPLCFPSPFKFKRPYTVIRFSSVSLRF